MSFHVYPVTETSDRCEDYKIRINGQSTRANTARVSAYPLNRRWPGHQREKEQSELVNFVSLSVSEGEPLHFEITLPEKSEKVIVRPQSLGIKPEIGEDGTVRFTLERAAYFTVEPYGRSRALHIFADPEESPEYADCRRRKDEENILYFGKGEHDVGWITLHSGDTLFLDEGAVVYACVRAIDAENIRILGRGILDNSRNTERILYNANEENNDVAVNNAVREHTVQFEYCTNVSIEGITIRDSLVYTVRPVACRNLHIENVKAIGNWRYNSDGIDMHNCENVHINNCFLRTFDDSLCVKGFDCYYENDVEKAVHDAMYRNGKSYDIFRNVLVENCTIWNDWGHSLCIGAETRAEEMSDITFRSCHILHVTGGVMAVGNVDYADVHDVTFEDMEVEYDDVIPRPQIQKSDRDPYVPVTDFYPALLDASVVFHREYSAGGTRRGINRRICFRNIRLFGAQPIRMVFRGFDKEHMTKDVTVSGIWKNGERITDFSEVELLKDENTENIKLI